MTSLLKKALFVGRGPWSKVLQDNWCATKGTNGCEVVGRDAIDALQNYEYDVAFIVTPPQAHRELLPLVWARKKVAWIEKPFASSREEATTLLTLWHAAGKPPCYVNFPHLRLPAMEEVLKIGHLTVQGATAVVGGPGPDRAYMNGIWDWGAHASAFFLALNLQVWTQGSKSITRQQNGRAWAHGVVGPVQVMVGNGFSEKTVRYQVAGKVGLLNDPHHLNGLHPVPFYSAFGLEYEGKSPIQKGMCELVDVLNGASVPAHLNWDLLFANAVTANLATLCPII